MLHRLFYLSIPLIFLCFPVPGQSVSGNLPLPNGPQLRWQQYERIMFVHFDPATWQGRSQDNHSTPLDRINPTQLDTDQWAETAVSWGARLILFVAKHTGGFCWWQTETSEYSIKNTPWKNGKGDVLVELSESCKKYGLDLGVYIYPGDLNWGAGIGSGGITKDPSKQQDYNKMFRQQLTEVLTRYGPMREVWFDGNCKVPISDILEKHSSDAVIFQGKSANIRWVGNEAGIVPYPNWYTLKSSDLATGVATAIHSDPYGDAYAPVEADVPLLKTNKGHRWFWGPETDHMLMNLDQLMDLYYKSVGRGSVLLLNSTQDTTGLIPASHVEVYKKFGEEINNRFSKPIKRTSGTGEVVEISFEKPTIINHVILQEDISKGQRVLSYKIEGHMNGQWKQLLEGSSIGNKKIDHFKSIELDKLRVRFIKSKATPQIANLAVYNIKAEVVEGEKQTETNIIAHWQPDTYGQQWKEVTFNLTPYVNAVGQYDIAFTTLDRDRESKEPAGLEFIDWQLEMYGRNVPEAIEKADNNLFRLTRSQDTADEFPTILKMKIKSKPAKSAGEIIIRQLNF